MKIAILTPNKTSYTETFIQNHIEYLPFEKIVIYGDVLPYITDTLQPTKFQIKKNTILNFIRAKLSFPTISFKEQHLQKILLQHKVDVVFAEYLITGAEVVNVCERSGIPIICTALGYEISVYKLIEQYEVKYKKLFQYASAIVVVSNHMKKNILDLDCPPQKIVYSPIGPSKEFFELLPNYNSKQVLAIGRFVEKKAPHLTILAFYKVLKQHEDATLVMAGDGHLLNMCKDLVKALQIEKSVFFKGKINQKEQRDLLQNSLMFIQHSKVAEDGDSEGTPVAILEASASGLPVVSTNHGGIPDVIISKVTGLLCDEFDIEQMSKQILQLLDNKDYAKSLGQAGKLRVQEKFSLEKHIFLLKDLILNAK